MDKNNHIDKNLKLEVDTCELLLKKLETVKVSLAKAVEKERQKRQERADAINKYTTQEEIQDAYGYGMITDDERYILLNQLEKNQQHVDDTRTKNDLALSEINQIMQKIRKDQIEFEFEMLPEEDKEKRIRQHEEQRTEMEARRKARSELL